ncbi:Cyclin-D3-1 [Apostasia shenzhenica]|uniref:Cyclin-D3-1 n=1 Tax=Apostasia shenzhenica TaxID=1088818 RepID=A0A2I0AIQ1_9ASPA|nr:Cyclin-D3-1 [Apostasia shenzhenica]
MGISYDYSSSILLCAEDRNSILNFDEVEEEEVEINWSDWPLQRRGSDIYADSLMGFPLLSDECFALLFSREVEHQPREDYAKRLLSGSLDVSVRREAIDWIFKVHAHYNFKPLCAYLSVNYLDRFLSSYELPQGKAWMSQLLAVSCLSLAAKMDETEAPLSIDLQVGEAKFIFESRTIKRMELLVLSTLKWRMQTVSPFSFIDYFLHKLKNGDPSSELSVPRSVELILSTIRGVEFLAFRPSEIAAATALSVMKEENQTLDVENAITCLSHVDKERVLICFEVIQEERIMSSKSANNGIPSVSSPIGVLDAANCLSYNSDEMNSLSQTSSHCSSPAAKRRKISGSSPIS